MASFRWIGLRRSDDECQANNECPNRHEPGERFCAYHLAVEAAKRGDPEAQRLCLQRWGLVVVAQP